MTAIISTLVMTHITIVCVTLYLHRSQAHRSVEFHPTVAHAMRLWLWLTTAMQTREWVAVHRCHHRYSDRPGDPHSPHIWGIGRVMLAGAWLYNQASKQHKLLEQYGTGTPDDWVERKIYSAWPWLGVVLMLIIDLTIFGWWGLLVWATQMVWVPFWAAGVINGLAHWWGYTNGKTRDNSGNLVPWGIFIGGEELHNNHHLAPASAKLSQRRWEFDIGWLYIVCLQWVRLAKVR